MAKLRISLKFLFKKESKLWAIMKLIKIVVDAYKQK